MGCVKDPDIPMPLLRHDPKQGKHSEDSKRNRQIVTVYRGLGVELSGRVLA